MLEKRLETLEQEKQKAIERVKEPSTDKKTVDLAIREIEINAISAKKYLGEISDKGYSLTDGLSRIDKDYHSKGNFIFTYRSLCNHLEHYTKEIKQIPKRVEEGIFEPFFAKEY